jgi:hypothetical protein
LADAVLARNLVTQEDFSFGRDGQHQLTRAGRAKFERFVEQQVADGREVPDDAEGQLVRSAYAIFELVKEDNWIDEPTKDGNVEIVIVDEKGEPLYDARRGTGQQWRAWHQALAYRNGLDIPALQGRARELSVEEFFRRARAAGGSVTGMSGTADLVATRLREFTGRRGGRSRSHRIHSRRARHRILRQRGGTTRRPYHQGG